MVTGTSSLWRVWEETEADERTTERPVAGDTLESQRGGMCAADKGLRRRSRGSGTSRLCTETF